MTTTTYWLNKDNWQKMQIDDGYLITPADFPLVRQCLKIEGETKSHWKIKRQTDGEIEDLELIRFFLGIPAEGDFFKYGRIPKIACHLHCLVDIKPIIVSYYRIIYFNQVE